MWRSRRCLGPSAQEPVLAPPAVASVVVYYQRVPARQPSTSKDKKRFEVLRPWKPAARARVNASSSSSSGACALVSSSGALLANSRGAAIDAHQLVARIGLSPTATFEAYAGRPRTASCTSLIYLIACYSLLHPVLHPLGARTSVRFVQLSFFEAARNMSPSKLRHVLELDRLTTPNFTVTFSGTAYEIQRLKLKQVATRFMRREVPQQPFTTTTPLPRCNMAGCETGDRIITGRYPSSGVLALQSMFDHHQCAWVQLFGFDDPDHGSHPYHYWADGSVHDGQSSQVFYGSKLRQSSGSHDFEAEHWFLYNVLGKGSWRIDAQAYRRECIHPRRAPACASLPHRTTDEPARALPQLELPPFTKRLFPSSAPFLVLPQHWSRSKAVAAREQVLEAMGLCHDTGEGGDNRTMGISDIAKAVPRRFHLITAFAQDRRLHRMAASHLGMAPADVRVKTLAGSTAPGQASGAGWHKDGLKRGVKVLMYLDDVHEGGVGPFAMLLNYSDATLKHATDRRGRRTRFDEAAVDGQVKQGARVCEIFGGAGTAVIFETSSVHRGMPARIGGRVTLTNYYHNDLSTCGA